MALIGRLLAEARNRGGLSPLERDLVLEKLRSLYRRVLAMETAEEPETQGSETVPSGRKEAEGPVRDNTVELPVRSGKDGLDEKGMADAVHRADQEDPGRITFYVDLDRDTEYDLPARDKARIVNELFRGDGAAFDAFMTRILRFGDLNEAVLYIQDHYRWDPRSEGLRLIVDLLNAKLA